MDAIRTPSIAAAIAAHRFGLGEPTLIGIGSDPRGWLAAQVGPAEPQRGDALTSGVDGLKRYAEFVQRQTSVLAAPVVPEMAAATLAAAVDPLRATVQADQRARLATAVLTGQPFNERLALFWANHFTVSTAKGSVRGIAGAFEREAIRPRIGASFEALLRAAVTHAGMLRYLDNDSSAGPGSLLVRRLARRSRADGRATPRITGLNENLAREVLELHTLGVSGGGAAYGGWGGYTQADVTEFARVLTGWRVPLRELAAGAATTTAGAAPLTSRFDPAWHDPGTKTVLFKRYADGPDALPALLHDLATHPSTARFIATKLARHFVADDPPPALVARLAARFSATGGDLPSVYRALIDAPEAWLAHPAKLKTPQEFVISSARLLALNEFAVDAWLARQPDGGTGLLGQRVQAAPSPAGWPDRADEWLGPDAVWKRVEWASRVADRVGRLLDARALAMASLGPLLHDDTARQIERAADGPQALTLLLLAPEFQRR